MDFMTYQTQAASTAIYPHAGTGAVPALAYVCLGLSGESSEVLEKHLHNDPVGLVAELGDVAWYLARLHTELGLPALVSPGQVEACDAGHLVVAAGRCAELAKKALRDDAGALTDDRRALFAAAVGRVVAAWAGVCLFSGVDPGLVLAGNAAKLADRKARGVLAGSGDTR